MIFPDTSFKAYRVYLDVEAEQHGEIMSYVEWVKWVWDCHALEEKKVG